VTRMETSQMGESEDLFAPDSGTEPTSSTGAGANKRRRVAGRLMGVVTVAGALALLVLLWVSREHHVRTDDAIVHADMVRIAPMVGGHIVELPIRDGQRVRAGDLLFSLDPRPYALAVERTVAERALVESEIEQMQRTIESARAGAEGTRANLERVRFEHDQAITTLGRLEPLLSRGYVTAEAVDQARLVKQTTGAALAMAEDAHRSAGYAVPLLSPLRTRLQGVDTSIRAAELELEYTRVRAPVDGRVVNLNVSRGSFAAPGIPVLMMIDTANWYVTANVRETDLHRIQPGMTADVRVMIDPQRRFGGTVENIGWAVHSEDEFDLFGIPYIRRTLNWVRLAQRFPVRIRVDDPRPAELFRMGASAVVTIHTGRPPAAGTGAGRGDPR